MTDIIYSVSKEDISKISAAIKEKFKPDRIILFGSHAAGTVSQDSDVDLLVIMDTRLSPREQAFLIRKEINTGFPIDIIVRTESLIKERLEMGDFFIKDIVENGIEL